MLTPDDGRTDGGRTRYLERVSWRARDPELFDALKRAVPRPRARQVRRAEAFFPGATFFTEEVPDEAAARAAWFERALTAFRCANVVFLAACQRPHRVRSERARRAFAARWPEAHPSSNPQAG